MGLPGGWALGKMKSCWTTKSLSHTPSILPNKYVNDFHGKVSIVAKKRQVEGEIRGAIIRLYPTREQEAMLNKWRVRTIALWNLLLRIQESMYSGKRGMLANIGWRKILHAVELETFAKRTADFEAGTTKKNGDPKVKEAPKPLDPEHLRAILKGRNASGRPRLFIWDDALNKLMARLKQVPLTGWIADMPASSAQRIVKELCNALRKMISDRKAGRTCGFPRRKRSSYASGSIYLSNIAFVAHVNEMNGPRRKWPRPLPWLELKHGLGRVRAGTANIPADAKAQGIRIYRIGDTWWAAMQYVTQEKDTVPQTTREVGVKVAATVIFTAVVDPDVTMPRDERIYERYQDGNQTFVRIRPPERSKRDEALMAIDSRRASRKKKRSKAWYDAQSRLADQHAYWRNARAYRIHAGSRWLADTFETINIDEMDVASMMRKDAKKSSRRLRKINAHAAMSMAKRCVEYKAQRASRVLNKSHKLTATTQTCAVCGTIHPAMAKGKKTIVCRCGNVMGRRENAAALEAKMGKTTKRATKVLEKSNG